MKMTKEEVKSLFTLAGFTIEAIEALIDGYSFTPEDPRFYETPPRCCWWFVKTDLGWIKIGWRKRVIEIDWTHTSVRALVTDDEVTNSDCYVHAWNMLKAAEYLQALRKAHRQKSVKIENALVRAKDLLGHLLAIQCIPRGGEDFGNLMSIEDVLDDVNACIGEE